MLSIIKRASNLVLLCLTSFKLCETSTLQNTNAEHKRSLLPHLPYGTFPIDLSQIPELLGTNIDSDADSHSINIIKQKLSLYTFSVDGKNFEALRHVFAEDAVANYSAPLFEFSGLANITTILEQSVLKVTTQHMLGSQFVEIADVNNAFSVSYFQAVHLGKGAYTGEVLYGYGEYQDSWFRENQASQDWFIAYRNVVYMVCHAKFFFPGEVLILKGTFHWKSLHFLIREADARL